MPLKIVTVVGARPQFIKTAAISRVLIEQYASAVHEVLVHTGQHYDDNMSGVFFEELGIPPPAYHFELAGGSHAQMTGRMLPAIETVLLAEKPDWVLIYGDTNSTLAAALAAAKLHVPVAHVESGLRSFNMRMPEEINRIVADRLSSLLFCPSATSVDNLANEGIVRGVHLVGDVMYDVALHVGAKARRDSQICESLGVAGRPFVLATCHRAENTDDLGRLSQIVDGLRQLSTQMPVVLPLHPRTSKILESNQLMGRLQGVTLTAPLSFIDMVALEQSATVVVTDSGGVQKEAFFYGVPCVTTRDETEWVETVRSGWNTLVGADADAICTAALRPRPEGVRPEFYGSGSASKLIVSALLQSV